MESPFGSVVDTEQRQWWRGEDESLEESARDEMQYRNSKKKRWRKCKK